MATNGTNSRRGRKLKFRGLWIPREIERIPEEVLCSRQKRLCGRISSFGVKGLFESESTLGSYFGVSRYTIMRDIKRLKKLRLIMWLKIHGETTCMWLRCNTKVQEAEYLGEGKKRMKNPAYTCGAGATGGVAQAQQVPVAPAQHNYNKSITTTSAALPLPAVEQARRLKEKEERQKAVLDTEIRKEFEKRMPIWKPGNWEEAKRRAEVFTKLKPVVIEGIEAGLSVVEAVDRVFNENEELILGGKRT